MKIDKTLESMSIRNIIDDIDDGDIVLQPGFQRRYIHKTRNVASIIDSILAGVPMSIYLWYNEETKSFHVLDGQQKLTSIYRFVKGTNGVDTSKDPHGVYAGGPIKIKGYDKNVSFNEMSKDDKDTIRKYTMTVHKIKCSFEDALEVFYRINSNTTVLNAVETNYAWYYGITTDRINDLMTVAQDLVEARGRGYALNDSRMRDIETVLYAVEAGINLFGGSFRTGGLRNDDVDVFEYLRDCDDEEVTRLKAFVKNAGKIINGVGGDLRHFIIFLTALEPIQRYKKALPESYSDEIHRIFKEFKDSTAENEEFVYSASMANFKKFKEEYSLHVKELKEKVGSVVGGKYGSKRRTPIPSSTRNEVKARSGGVCESDGCENKAEEIHHIDNNAMNNDLDNLEHLCHGCHNKRHNM